MCAICLTQLALPEAQTPLAMCAACLSSAFQAQTQLLQQQAAASMVVNNNFTVNVNGGSATTVNNAASASAARPWRSSGGPTIRPPQANVFPPSMFH